MPDYLLPAAVGRDEELERAIRKKDVRAIVTLMFEGSPPVPRSGFRVETELWDYKRDIPPLGPNTAPQWAGLATDVIGFHNKRGGVLIFGIDDSLQFTGIATRYDSKLVNDRLRKYVGDVLWCEFHREFIQRDQQYLGFLIVPPRGPRILRFVSDAYDSKGKVLFREGDSAVREGDSTHILRGADVDAYARKLVLPTVAKVYEVDEPFFRVLAPDYNQFVGRPLLAEAVERSLHDPRISTTNLLGIGGAGKTALATWAVLRAYERGDFSLIVSTTAKDRELTPSGIIGLPPSMSNFESMLNGILEVVGFPDQKEIPVRGRELLVRDLLSNSNGLLYIDNLETVDDSRIIEFLNELPIGVRAITTSRRTRVRVAARPVEVGPLTEDEVRAFVRSLATLPGYQYVVGLKPSEIDRIGTACDRTPLAIRWALARASSPAEALFIADGITKSGRRGEELLEFAFRRVFDSMSPHERRVLETLAMFQAPLSTEALLVGAGTSEGPVADPLLLDAIEELVDDALVHRVFDAKLNDYAYALLPVTRAFVYAEVTRSGRRADEIRRRLTDYFEARDVRDKEARLVIRESRQGHSDPETSLLDLAIGARTRGDYATAHDLFERALSRNPRSWKVAREFAEFHRHHRHNQSEALRLYEQAAANAPRRGSDRALIFREWGMLLRDSGQPDATQRAVECFEEALAESPNDEVAAHALATMLDRQGNWRRVAELCEPLLKSRRHGTREAAVKTLFKAYDRLGETFKAAQLRLQLDELGVKYE